MYQKFKIKRICVIRKYNWSMSYDTIYQIHSIEKSW